MLSTAPCELADTTILLADPDVELLNVLRIVLPRFGLRVETSDSALDALDRVVQRRRHILVIDDSFAVSPHVDVLRARVDRLIVLVSDWDRSSQIRAACSADSCLRKPFAIDELLHELAP